MWGERRSKQMRVEIGGEAIAHRDEAFHVLLAQAVDLAQAEPQREECLTECQPAKAGIQ